MLREVLTSLRSNCARPHSYCHLAAQRAATGHALGVWAFTGFRQFLDDERIGLVINCLNSGQGEIIGTNSNDGRYMDRVEIALPRVAFALALAKNILVHCTHGVHRSGSFVILLLALILRLRFLGEASPGWNFLF